MLNEIIQDIWLFHNLKMANLWQDQHVNWCYYYTAIAKLSNQVSLLPSSKNQGRHLKTQSIFTGVILNFLIACG